MKLLFTFLLAALVVVPARAQDDALYRFPDGVHTRWTSFENPSGAPGEGARENARAKGHAFDTVEPGASVVLADVEGTGVLHRIWMTVDRRDPRSLRALRLTMTWDDAATPAVDVPLGDFFAATAGRLVAFENAFFSSPEGRSFNTIVPMPFRSRARVVLTNEGTEPVKLFYDLNYTLVPSHPEDLLYFHAAWRRERPATLGRDFEILPAVQGRGRFLGTHVGVLTGPEYAGTWWGEGEVKMYLDGDGEHPTLVGSGTEDYIGTGWGQGAYAHRYQGAPVSDAEAGLWSFYRYHVPDPVLFHEGLRVALQQIGGGPKAQVRDLLAAGVALRPISMDAGQRDDFIKFFEQDPPPDLSDPALPDGWVNFYRQDDVAAVALFYLDRPARAAAPLAPVDERVAGTE